MRDFLVSPFLVTKFWLNIGQVISEWFHQRLISARLLISDLWRCGYVPSVRACVSFIYYSSYLSSLPFVLIWILHQSLDESL